MGSCRVAADTPTAVGKFTIEKIPSAASRQPPRDKSLRLSKMTLTFIVLLLIYRVLVCRLCRSTI